MARDVFGTGIVAPPAKAPRDQFQEALHDVLNGAKTGVEAQKIMEAYANMKGSSWGNLSGPAGNVAQGTVNQILNPAGRRAMIEMRLRGTLAIKNFETFLEGDKVYAAIVTTSGGVFLEDDAAMFPSDTFMAQLRLLLP